MSKKSNVKQGLISLIIKNEVLIVVNLHYYKLYNPPKPIASEKAKVPINYNNTIVIFHVIFHVIFLVILLVILHEILHL
jgi:hypothetical protein